MDTSMCEAEYHGVNNKENSLLGREHRNKYRKTTDTFSNIDTCTRSSRKDIANVHREASETAHTTTSQYSQTKMKNENDPTQEVFWPFFPIKTDTQSQVPNRKERPGTDPYTINAEQNSYASKRTNSAFTFDTIDQPVVTTPGHTGHAAFDSDSEHYTHTIDGTHDFTTNKSTDTSSKELHSMQNSPLILPSNSDKKSGQFFTYSPLLTESYKHGQYFHFPDVDSPSEVLDINHRVPRYCNNNIFQSSANFLSSSINNNYNLKNNNLTLHHDTSKRDNYECPTTTINDNGFDKKSNLPVHGEHQTAPSHDDQVDDKRTMAALLHSQNVKSEAARRSRLKSISLDSDGAKLVEENLYIPVEEIMERANSALYDDFANDTEHQAEQSETKLNMYSNSCEQARDLAENGDKLLLNGLEACRIREYTNGILISDEKPLTPKTPTLFLTRQKAISFDSELFISNNSNLCARSMGTDNDPNEHTMSQSNMAQVDTDLSSSVPTSPKMKLRSAALSANYGRASKKNIFRNSYPKAASTECNHQHQLDGSDNSERCNVCSLSNIDYIFNLGQLKPSSYQLYVAQGTANPNLKTLPEVECKEDPDKMFKTAAMDNSKGSGRVNISNAFGTNSCNDIANVDIEGSAMSLEKRYDGRISLSNYSLSNLQGSHCSLSRSNFNIYSSGGMLSSGHASQQQFNTSENLNMKLASPSVGMTNKLVLKKPSDSTNGANECKKNLLQRRGSNTSLTLNIVGDHHDEATHKHISLNRFNSHSSLNIITTPFDMPRLSSFNAKKGLLERRNSNTSLTLNIQKRALSTSTCNFRDSNLSLNSITNNSEKSLYESRICSFCGGTNLSTIGNCNMESKNRYRSSTITESRKDSTQGSQIEISNRNAIKMNKNSPVHKRKYLSSENLYIKYHSFHAREATESEATHDHAIHSSNIDLNKANRCTDNLENCTDFNKQFYCQCGNSAIRNITTKPLSPQATSEDFKIYLANIQMLQNASNALSYSELQKLIYVFGKSYVDQRRRENDHEHPPYDEDCVLSEIEQNTLLTNIHQEFWDLPTNYQEKPLVFGSQIKNRYKTILPNEHSRVLLQSELVFDLSRESGLAYSASESYINANYIKGPDYASNAYIATQGPMTNTTYDFWLMVYQNSQKCALTTARPSKTIATTNTEKKLRHQQIIMLTDIIENDESKCAIYFPQEVGKALYFINGSFTQSRYEKMYLKHLEEFYSIEKNWIVDDDNILFIDGKHFNYFCIKNVAVYSRNGYSIRKLQCLYKSYVANDEKQILPELKHFTVYHYWFQHWPDHRSPENVDVVLDMCLDVLNSYNEDIDRPISVQHSPQSNTYQITAIDETTNCVQAGPMPIIHCSAGIGRTGCVSAIMNGLHQIRNTKLISHCKDDINKISVDILGIVSNLRLQRGGMVQNSEQYELIHRALCLYLHRVSYSLINNV